MRIKTTYSSMRKERSELHCILPSLNYHTKFQTYRIQPQFLNNYTNRVHLFLTKVKRPTKIILKAPFHYKVGKHRLTLAEFLYKKITYVPAKAGTVPQNIIEIVKSLDSLVIGIPTGLGPVLQTKNTVITVPFLLQKNIFINN